MVKIAVELPAGFADAGDYLSDARALDAAGVDTLWLADGDFDPWLVLAGIATVPGRVRLAVPISARDPEAADAAARRMTTLDRLSRGRALATVVAADDPARTEALIAHARDIAPASVLLRTSGDGHALVAARLADGLVSTAVPTQCRAAFDQARRQRERDRLTAPFELWARVGPPRGREHWRNVLETADEAGATGILVPADPRLLDLLRNAEDRSDLTLAQG